MNENSFRYSNDGEDAELPAPLGRRNDTMVYKVITLVIAIITLMILFATLVLKIVEVARPAS